MNELVKYEKDYLNMTDTTKDSYFIQSVASTINHSNDPKDLQKRIADAIAQDFGILATIQGITVPVLTQTSTYRQKSFSVFRHASAPMPGIQTFQEIYPPSAPQLGSDTLTEMKKEKEKVKSSRKNIKRVSNLFQQASPLPSVNNNSAADLLTQLTAICVPEDGLSGKKEETINSSEQYKRAYA